MTIISPNILAFAFPLHENVGPPPFTGLSLVLYHKYSFRGMDPPLPLFGVLKIGPLTFVSYITRHVGSRAGQSGTMAPLQKQRYLIRSFLYPASYSWSSFSALGLFSSLLTYLKVWW